MIIQDSKHKGAGQTRTNIMFFRDDETEPYRVEHNSIVISGAQFTACKHFGIEPAIILPNYNTDLGIENMVVPVGKKEEEYAFLFCCGTSGCGTAASDVYPVDYHNRIPIEALVPFRYENNYEDLDKEMRTKYFGRKEIGDKIAYYYKAFDSKPQVYLQFEDGTQIDGAIYNEPTSQKAETMVEIRLKITKSDLRDWFFATEGIENARINTISILTAWEYTDPITGYKYYNNVRPLTQFNFSNEWLIDLTKSITIVYQIFY